MRVESNKPNPKGGWFHKRDGAALIPLPPKRVKRLTDEELNRKWAPIAMRCYADGQWGLHTLAAELGVYTSALRCIYVGRRIPQSKNEIHSWTFPERSATGMVVGINRRFCTPVDGKTKMCMPGSRRGLVYADEWFARPGAIWIVEGGSDVAAGLTMDLAVIGRPSNTGGIGYLTRILGPHRHRHIIVAGENDARLVTCGPEHAPDCRYCQRCWPGKSGAISTAKALAERLGVKVGVVMPPKGFKDLRDYVRQIPEENRDGARIALQGGHYPPASRKRRP